jgi:two-component system CheB/CheR fusion protein
MRVRPYRTLSGVVDGVVLTFVDISEQKRHQETLARHAAIVESSDDAIIGHSLDGIVTSWNRGAEKIFGFSVSDVIGKPLSILLPQGDADKMPAVLERVKRGEAVQSFEISRAGKDGKSIQMSLTVSPVRDGEHTIIAASTVARDVSERVRAEKQRALLMGELDHRVKNTLSTVLAIIRQTATNGATVAEFSEDLQARLMALAQTHNLLNQGHWESASLRQILKAELSPFTEEAKNPRFSLDGEDIRLTPGQAVTLGMSFHELAVNAAKYGALSVPAGRVDVSWIVEKIAAQTVLRLSWVESGGPPVKPPTRHGFGTYLLEHALPHETGGEVTLEYAPKGVRCAFSMPVLLSGK